jgi:hypothetical protein
MGELLGGLIALFVWLLIIPIVIVAVLFGLAIAGLTIAFTLAMTIIGIMLKLLIAAAPFLLVLGLLYLIFRPSQSSRRQITQQ